MEAAGAAEISRLGPGPRLRMAPTRHRENGDDRKDPSSIPGVASHDVKNLFIVDGSIFVTAGGLNPTSTIQALALYIADKMKKNLANLFD